jgi:hypothetical protein
MIKDSGTRQEFETGAVRDCEAGKGRMDLLPAHALMMLAKHFEAGATKYGDRNWEKGIPLSRFFDSALRHMLKFLDGKRDEPHLVAAVWNLTCLIQTRHWIEEGRLPDTLMDVPEFEDDPYGFLSAPKPADVAAPVRPARDLAREATLGGKAGLRASFETAMAASGADPRLAAEVAAGLMMPDNPQWPGDCDVVRIAYISGPMRGYNNFNFDSFDKVRDVLLNRGYVVASPADLDRSVGFDPANAPKEFTKKENREFASRDVAVLLRLMEAEKGDLVTVLPGWEHSTGARAEVFLALWLGLPVFHSSSGNQLDPEKIGDTLSRGTRWDADRKLAL